MKKYKFLIPIIVLLVAVPLLFTLSVSVFGEKVGSEALSVAEDAIVRAAVQCYALEGFYPPNLEYLVDNYGININSDVIFVDFIYIGSNLLPVITVLPVT